MNETKPQNRSTDRDPRHQIILVVDARPTRRFYTSIFLQRLKYQVIMSHTAEDALIFLGLAVPRIIIADHELPQMTGLELLRKVRNDQRTRNVPFIVYTSSSSQEVQQACVGAGCSAFLSYPCSLEELYTSIQNATHTKPRRFVRLTTTLDVVVGDDLSTSGVRSSMITAISEQGMFVSTDVPLALGSILTFTFYLPNAPGWLIRVEGQVLFNHFGPDKRQIPGMAIKFLKIGEQEREFVRQFIRQELMEGIVPDQTQGGPAILRGMKDGGDDSGPRHL